MRRDQRSAAFVPVSPRRRVLASLVLARPGLQSGIHLLGADRQRRESHANRIEDRIGHGGRHGDVAEFADGLAGIGGWTGPGLDEHGGQDRDVPERRQFIVAQVRGGHCAVLHLQMFAERLAHALHYTTFDLALMRQWIDDCADVMGRHQPHQLHLPSIRVHGHFRHLRAKRGHFCRPTGQVAARAAHGHCPLLCGPGYERGQL